MKENKKVQVNSNILVGEGKSSRLAALSNRVTQQNNLTGSTNNKIKNYFASGLKPETEIALQQAGRLIEGKISLIMNDYPSGKKKTFFKLRHGVDIEQIKQMALKDVFALLRLETTKIQKFGLIEKLDSHGNNLN